MLGWRLVGLGRAAAEGQGLVSAAAPVLRQLRDATGESAQLYVPDGDHRICVASLESPHGLRTIVDVGAVLPIGVGSAGRVLLGELEGSRREWLESVGEREAGVASVSAPVHGPDGAVVAAIGVSGPIERHHPPARTPLRRRGRRGRYSTRGCGGTAPGRRASSRSRRLGRRRAVKCASSTASTSESVQ